MGRHWSLENRALTWNLSKIIKYFCVVFRAGDILMFFSSSQISCRILSPSFTVTQTVVVFWRGTFSVNFDVYWRTWNQFVDFESCSKSAVLTAHFLGSWVSVGVVSVSIKSERPLFVRTCVCRRKVDDPNDPWLTHNSAVWLLIPSRPNWLAICLKEKVYDTKVVEIEWGKML